MNKDNKDLAKQIVHEAEVTRQYARYKIPAKVEIDGKIYVVDNWSLGGLAVKNAPREFCKKPSKKAKLIFKFDTFETVVDNLNLEFICAGKTPEGDHYSLLGAKFHNLDDYQISILNQIITSYINGDIITKEDILYAATRNITYIKKEKKKLEKKKADLILIMIYGVIFLIFSFIGYIAYYRTFVVESINGYIDANITVIRAPFLSYINFTKPYKTGDKIEQNETIAIARFVNGGMQPIISPVFGTVYKINVLEGGFRKTGEPIMTILDSNASLYIVAKVDHKFFPKLKIGDIAKITDCKGDVFKAKIISINPAEEIDQRKAKVIRNVYSQARDYDKIILKPLKPLNKSLIDTAVFVKIDTFLQ